ncbi:nuclear transport factor 2 family protein [Microbulbifer thermotolerans]|uniref:YybH family protein n=1 Tax=Microbulbifer thermotolerans TaxID=252514 RepID=UPI0026730465|nr:nuclear transport factor 2 family protein [Microbulbifer thermotolerans]WKT60256.1 nuclear transport factor 2 family protein [Microbulbifer thermotolerans]
MRITNEGHKAHLRIESLLHQWAEAVRHNETAAIWRNHHPSARIFDALLPFQYPDLQSYRDNWDSWQPPFIEPPLFEFIDLQIHAGDTVAFAHCVLHCKGILKDGRELDDRVRATFGFIHCEGRWLINHQHISLPVRVEAVDESTSDSRTGAL